MKNKITKSILLILSMVCMLCSQISPIYADTNGTEMQVVQPEQLEIQLGVDWAGVEFQLKTDAGLYPGTIAVGEDGVLRLEIGGSSSYILSCMNSSVSAPDPTQAPATTEGTEPNTTEDAPQDEVSESEPKAEGDMPVTEMNEPNTVAGIPVLHIALFGGGLVIAVGSLIVMRVMSRRHAEDADYDEEDE